jgi:hypothetical protein
MIAPAIALTSIAVLVTTKTQSRISQLYTQNPAEAASCPQKSQRADSALLPCFHCLHT